MKTVSVPTVTIFPKVALFCLQENLDRWVGLWAVTGHSRKIHDVFNPFCLK